ncbi:pitrilysin family protein [Pontixanthobacter aestiaquae]|uniref:Insulinase family protein n=1 Tax=Pontixanthobacter aestiaquae TaxID=1509367 RepID=A0A844ZAP2_9SPHN|nr:pitrilysin family protein [Pontixanthobacter aestiaquae]MDN3646089.1 pitrilysin family protein [Pontixanthobacter aestiaquae]MXO82919.1 insulinase family protein [Pontixanthobacter aestiaquae]
MRLTPITRFASASLLVLSLAAAPAMAQDAPFAAEAMDDATAAMADDPATPAPVADLIDAVSIPYDQFELDNGLTVLVHEDRKAPVVAVSVWYNVGSKHEPKGKTGFAHLFEHLMFNGSENAPGDFFEPLQQVGATDFNGTTWFDRTNYFQTVPTGALDRTLMLESDRMGYLLGAVTQEKLDNQIGVVQNEKRQGDNQPYGLTEYEQLENLYPSGHPYHHSTIGSMDDLSSATLEDVKQWFRDNYGPNNAVIVLAGDIDTATAQAKMNTWFGAIPRGPETPSVDAPVPTLDEAKSKTIYDKVATTRIYRMWAIPGLDNPDFLPLSMGASVLGGLASSRLDNALVREQQLAVRVVANAQIFAQAGQFVVYADAKPGVDKDTVAAALDAEIAKFLEEGPTAEEIQRATTVYAASQIRGLEQVGGFSGKAPTLAEGFLYQGDPAAYKTTLNSAAALTPEEVRSVTEKWLSRPVFELIVEPGDRTEGGENRGGFVIAPESYAGSLEPEYYANPLGLGMQGATGAHVEADRSKLPDVGELKPLDFPDIERATLSNGMEVYFAKRDAVPVVSVRVQFNAGYAADPRDRLGLQSLMLQLMDEGTTTLDSTALAIEREKYGASIFGTADADTTSFGLDAITPNLLGSLNLLADYIRNPAFDENELERVRAQQLTRITSELNNPAQIAQRALMPIIYGDQHPYGIPPSGTGEAEVVSTITKEEISDFHRVWLRPDMARVLVVGDTSLDEAVKLLEASFGDWQAPNTPAPVKSYDAPVPDTSRKIVLIDRPNSPQSIIMGGHVLDQKGTDDLTVLRAANEVFGGSFLSRINMNLRETKGWSYGVRSLVRTPLDRGNFLIYAPVQADRTGDSITELFRDLAAYTTTDGVTDEELTRLINGNVRELPGQFETSRDVLGGITNIITYGRPDDYYETLAEKYSALTTDQLDAAARQTFSLSNLTLVVVGDADVVRPQLDGLGIPVEVRETSGE